MPVILLGALDGMPAAGILGMFVGATCLRWATRSSWAGCTPIPKPIPRETRTMLLPGASAGARSAIDAPARAERLNLTAE